MAVRSAPDRRVSRSAGVIRDRAHDLPQRADNLPGGALDVLPRVTERRRSAGNHLVVCYRASARVANQSNVVRKNVECGNRSRDNQNNHQDVAIHVSSPDLP